MEPIWSIIIPARNEEQCLAQCLQAICALRYPLHDIEVIVADNGSTDNTVSLALSWSERVVVRVIRVPGLPVGAVRNAAVAHAQGRFLAFVDADCIVQPDWLSLAERKLNRDGDSIVGSFYALPPQAGWPARLWHRFFEEERRGETTFLPGGNLLLGRELFHQIGGFDTVLRSNEDSQFCARARLAGYKILSVPELASVHLGAERDLQHFIRRQLWHGSNVVNRYALAINSRAIALAAYTLSMLLLMMAAALFRTGTLFWSSLIGLLLPSLLLAGYKASRRRRFASAPPLALLLFTYSVARACVLPLALFRSLQ